MQNECGEGGQSYRQSCRKGGRAAHAAKVERAQFGAERAGDYPEHDCVSIEDEGARVGAHMQDDVRALLLQ
jgi:hypothetical protein